MTNDIFQAFVKALELIISLDPEVLNITFLSLRVSLIAVIIATIIGIPIGITIGSQKFHGRRIVLVITNTGMSFPPVVMGLLVFLLFSNSGPFVQFGIDILLTEAAMIIAQLLLAIPIITGLSISAVSTIDPKIRETAITLGANKKQIIWTQIREIRTEIFAAIIAAFGGAISEIGAVQIVGGNIRYHTRTLTTAIGRDIGAGRWEYALALGIILLLTALIVNIVFTYLQHSKSPRLVKGD
ncbi:MAG: Sulfate transport system permease protein CysW [Candidatus Heimdallarchaeota archaeon LC_3]|nr:MAG: Sulfate transport system permease protein CysW [Candidatus Heimdallarchaeota archaeon LC_3]